MYLWCATCGARVIFWPIKKGGVRLVQTYYAYLALVGGYLLQLAGESWQLGVMAYGLTALGGIALRRFSPWYTRAAGAALVCSVLQLGCLLTPALSLPALLATGVLHAFLCLGMSAQRAQNGAGSALEYVLLALAAVYALGGAVLFAGLADGSRFVFENLLLLVNTGGILLLIGIIFDVFRIQKLALKSETER